MRRKMQDLDRQRKKVKRNWIRVIIIRTLTLELSYIEADDMDELISGLNQYMSVELDGIDPTPEHFKDHGNRMGKVPGEVQDNNE
ncbi:hypothetical protein P4S72_08295 [Vibrio sp. PP-XX7]